MKGTFPFIATELIEQNGQSSKAHEPHHDLESLFWVLWIISINYNGPYGKHRAWVSPDGSVYSGTSFRSSSAAISAIGSSNTSMTFSTVGTKVPEDTSLSTPSSSAPTHPNNDNAPSSQSILHAIEGPNRGYVRYPLDDPQADSFVPVWATPEPHDSSFKDVVAWRLGAMAGETLGRLVNPISPYFLAGPGGTEFAEGIRTLAKRIRWESYIEGNKEKLRAPTQPITHEEFYSILLRMRDAIDDSDRPTEEEEKAARQEWNTRAELQAANFEEKLEIKKMEKKLEHREGPSTGTRRSKRLRDLDRVSNSHHSTSKRRAVSHFN